MPRLDLGISWRHFRGGFYSSQQLRSRNGNFPLGDAKIEVLEHDDWGHDDWGHHASAGQGSSRSRAASSSASPAPTSPMAAMVR